MILNPGKGIQKKTKNGKERGYFWPMIRLGPYFFFFVLSKNSKNGKNIRMVRIVRIVRTVSCLSEKIYGGCAHKGFLPWDPKITENKKTLFSLLAKNKVFFSEYGNNKNGKNR
jgi:hypothetical protein